MRSQDERSATAAACELMVIGVPQDTVLAFPIDTNVSFIRETASSARALSTPQVSHNKKSAWSLICDRMIRFEGRFSGIVV